jgi:hypothetical protein
MNRVVFVKPFPDMSLEIRFADGLVKRFDMRPFVGEGISAPLTNWEYFRQVQVEEGGGITWPNGYDFCPEFLREYVPDLANPMPG